MEIQTNKCSVVIIYKFRIQQKNLLHVFIAYIFTLVIWIPKGICHKQLFRIWNYDLSRLIWKWCFPSKCQMNSETIHPHSYILKNIENKREGLVFFLLCLTWLKLKIQNLLKNLCLFAGLLVNMLIILVTKP